MTDLYENHRRLWSAIVWRAFVDAVRFGDRIARDQGCIVRNSLSWCEGKDAAMFCDALGLDQSRLAQSAREKHAEYMASPKEDRRKVLKSLLGNLADDVL